MDQTLEYRTKVFYEKVKNIHGDKYDLSKVIYVNNHSPITIICQKHGETQITSGVLAKGGECSKCSYEKRGKKFRKYTSKEDIISAMKKIHNNKFEYKLSSSKVSDSMIVICPKHGEYTTTPYEHMKNNGSDCRQCFHESDKPLKRSTKSFINECIEIHGYKYDYSKTIYTGIVNNIIITCPAHGDFTQIADAHLNGCAGCPKCKSSTGENAIMKYLTTNNITYEFQKSFRKLKRSKKLRVDFYLPTHNLVIEYDGIHHYEKINFSGRFSDEKMEENLKNIQESDKLKNDFCTKNSIKMLRIPYWEKNNIETILSSSLK